MISVRLSFDAPSVGDVALPVDGERLLEALVAKGARFFVLEVDRIGSLRLPVADDAIFMADAANETAALDAEGAPHSVYLGDGALEVNGTRRGELFVGALRYTPHLHRALTVDASLIVPIDKYRRAWCHVIEHLLAASSRPRRS